MIVYKKDLLKALAEKGFTCNKMRREKILSESTMQNIRRGRGITTETINTICIILDCQPSDIIKVEPTAEEKIRFFDGAKKRETVGGRRLC